MRSGKVLVMMGAVLTLAASIEAAPGGRAVRAAVRLERAVEKRGPDTTVRAKLQADVAGLVVALRQARTADDGVRCFTYALALARVRGIDATLPKELSIRSRARVLHAVTALERVLERATRAVCP